MQVLERLFLDGPETPHEAKALSTETLLDILLILYNECCNSSLRKEKTLTDFIELGRKEGKQSRSSKNASDYSHYIEAQLTHLTRQIFALVAKKICIISRSTKHTLVID